MHVLLVFTRSHLNMAVFKRYKYRFTLIPALVLVSMWTSPLVFAFLSGIGLYWDEWHSLMQTFGFGRIYDGRVGNSAIVGRKRDMVFCFIIGFLPAGVLLGVFLVYFLVILPFMFVLAGLRQTTALVEYLAAFWLLTSLLYFWFDGFIWSVRRQDVRNTSIKVFLRAYNLFSILTYKIEVTLVFC